MSGVCFSCFLKVGTRRLSVNGALARDGMAIMRPSSVWGRGAKTGGQYHTDVLVCGPASLPEKKSMEKTLLY